MKPDVFNKLGPFSLSEHGARWKLAGPHGQLEWLSGKDAFGAMRAMLAAYEAWWSDFHSQRVYFIGASLESAAPVKIGISFNPVARLRTIQTGHPTQLRLLAIDYGGAKKEAELHRLFGNCRLNGEWFSITSSLRRRIEGLAGTLDDRLAEVRHLNRQNEWDDVLIERLT